MGSDKMAPFRQQAAAIGNIKKNVLDKLEKTESTLAELEAKLKEKKENAKLLTEESAPEGEEFKRYVSRLKTKSTLYKQSKAELSALKAENGVLRRTLEILEHQVGNHLLLITSQILQKYFKYKNLNKINRIKNVE